MLTPQTFIVDARGDSDRAVVAIAKILRPSRRYRILLRLQQIAATFACISMVLSPVTILLATSVLPSPTADFLRSVLLRPWICLVSLWLSMIVLGIWYPSYGGPSRLAPDPIDKYIRLVTPGVTGRRWKNMIYPAAFILACMIDGIGLFSLDSISVIRWATYLKAFIFAVVLQFCYAKIQWNLFTCHIGATFRRLLDYYGLNDLPPPPPQMLR